ncbi:MAG: dihydrodipicolinate synthase family protein [Verrucomicrobiales bacterium]
MNGRTTELRGDLLKGQVIPATPLALNEKRAWSERDQRALVRYYLDAGAGGIAVGVHTTQFEIRKKKHGLLRPVLELVSEEIEARRAERKRPVVKVAGVCGQLQQAFGEAQLAAELGYDAGLLSTRGLDDFTEKEIVEHCRIIAKVIPLIGFYLQASIGGRTLSYDFWRRFVDIPEVVAIKVAAFNRYHTWEVVRAVLESGREDVALYTGNDDNIIMDLLTPQTYLVDGERQRRYFSGGLLGQWAVGTRRAVKMLEAIKVERRKLSVNRVWLERNIALTDINAAIFDAANGFAGCVPGVMEVLRRQGLLPSILCLDPEETLSLGQARELDRVSEAYPDFWDDRFVRENLERWLS